MKYLEGYAADVWMTIPPCQTHTRQNSNQDHEPKYSRSKNFLHLCEVLEAMEKESLPKLIPWDNCVGFDKEIIYMTDVLISAYMDIHDNTFL